MGHCVWARAGDAHRTRRDGHLLWPCRPMEDRSSPGAARGWLGYGIVATRRELATFAVAREYVTALAFSPDGKTLATGDNKTVKLWNIASQQELATLTGHTDNVNSVAFSPDGRTLASCSTDSTVRLWDIASRRELTTLKYHTDIVASVAFTPDGKALVTGSSDRTARLWKTTSQDETDDAPGP